jgi:hypothetical protein
MFTLGHYAQFRYWVISVQSGHSNMRSKLVVNAIKFEIDSANYQR